MGTASSTKYLINSAGSLTEKAALVTTAGVGDAQALPALNASGVLDISILNGTVVSSGAGSASQTPILDSTGRLDQSTMPVGIVPDTAAITASEALSAGDLVNIWNNAGAFAVRKADASTSGKEAHGFVLSAVASAGTASVYFEGSNTQATGLTPGIRFLSDSVPGGTVAAAPTGTGKIVQQVGVAVSATTLNFEQQPPIVLA